MGCDTRQSMGSGAWWGGEEASKRTSGYLARALAMIFFEMSTPITVPVVAPWIEVWGYDYGYGYGYGYG